ncbi:flavodoxin domain-containing protein [Vaginisenegalia massiliensis]|uniref:flavodoxin domain-containing protein n=1 Tax=Vaginisenegalia massiliensis TaxID=2058294 RepID=UPI000F53A631|nr:flavodoxin domain-containing protein [Vaginisenegalia massiliensis]
MNLVIYQSRYGHTQQYAEWIAQELTCPLKTFKTVTLADIEAADTIIFGSGVMAGQYKDLGKFIELVKQYPDKHYAFFSVSITDPAKADNVAFLTKQINQRIELGLQEKIKYFFFRGGLDYERMNGLHRLIMRVMIGSLKKKPALSPDDQRLVDTYGKRLDYLDRQAIAPLLDYVHQMNH